MTTEAGQARTYRSVFDACSLVAAVVSIIGPVASYAEGLLLLTSCLLVGTWTTAAQRIGFVVDHPKRVRLVLAAFCAIFALSAALRIYGARDDASIAEQVAGIATDVSSIRETTASIDRSARSIDTKLDGLERETSTDPRKELAKLNIRWSEESLYERIREDDVRAVGLFLDAGMRPLNGRFWRFAIIDYNAETKGYEYNFNREIADMLVAAKAFDPVKACLELPGTFSWFRDDFERLIQSDADRVGFIRAVCARQDVRAKLREEIAQADRLARDPQGHIDGISCADRSGLERRNCETAKRYLNDNPKMIEDSGRLSAEAYRILAKLLG